MSFNNNNYQKFDTNKNKKNTIPEVKIPQNEQINQKSSNNLFDIVNNLRQRLMQLENRVTELSRMCPHNNNNNYKNT